MVSDLNVLHACFCFINASINSYNMHACMHVIRKKRGFHVAAYDSIYGERHGKPAVMDFLSPAGYVPASQVLHDTQNHVNVCM